VPVRSEIEYARTDQTKMQKRRRRARTTVEDKRQWPVGRGILGDIGGIEHRCTLLAGLIIKGQRAGGCRVGKSATRCIDGMLRDGIGRQEAQHALAGFAMLGSICLRTIFNSLVSTGDAQRAGEGRRQHDTQEGGECYRHAQLR
jgi:hypothetical protein